MTESQNIKQIACADDWSVVRRATIQQFNELLQTERNNFNGIPSIKKWRLQVFTYDAVPKGYSNCLWNLDSPRQ